MKIAMGSAALKLAVTDDNQGGSSLIGSWIIIALFARLSDTARRPAPRPVQEEGMAQVVRLQ